VEGDELPESWQAEKTRSGGRSARRKSTRSK
jgi:hypothetical protein